MAMPFVPPVNYTRPKESRPHRFAYDYGSVDPGMFTPPPESNKPKRAPKRSIAYTIPLPDEPHANSPNAADDSLEQPQGHVLGVNALALSFQGADAIDSASATGGVLFSGGRDGVVKAWNLNFPLKHNAEEASWSIDRHKAKHKNSKTSLRASRVVHADWVNDLVVVNNGDTVISASSDQTVRAWSPYREDERPQAIGSHMDYVKALAYSEHRQTVISGGLDRKIKLWDIGQGRKNSGPVCSLQEFGDASVSSSVYTLACNCQGTLVVSGSPEKPIRVWDTRSGRQVTMLSGHTDHIRSVLLSTDSELVLSGSSDTTVKLWSMRMRRCLSTFTQHSDSVWSLYSNHPRFQTFYSASRDGIIAKTAGAGMFSDEHAIAGSSANAAANRKTSLNPLPKSLSADDATPIANASGSGVVCVAIAKEHQGVVKLVAADETYIWTATKGTKLNRWLDVSIRSSHHQAAARPRGISVGSISIRSSSSAAASNANIQAVAAHREPVQPALTTVNEERSTNDSETDSDLADEEITQKSLLEHWQAYNPKISDATSGGSHGVASQQQQQCNHTGHRRNHTVSHTDINLAAAAAAASSAQSPSSAVSPVLRAIQAEQARRSIVRDSDSEDLFYDAQSGGSTVDSPASVNSGGARFLHNRSQSAGGYSASAQLQQQHQMARLGSITSVLASDQHPSSILHASSPGSSKADLLKQQAAADADTLSIPDSPLPVASLMKADMPLNAGSPSTQQQKVTINSIASVIPPATTTDDGCDDDASEGEVVPVRSKPEETIYGKHGLHRHKILDNKRQVLAQDTRGRVSLWDLLLCCRVYEFPETEEEAQKSSVHPNIHGKDFEAIQMALSAEPESVNSWCHVDTKIGALTVHLEESRVWNAEVHVDEVDGVTEDSMRAMGEHERVNIGHWMLKRLFLSYVRARVKRGPLSLKDATRLNFWATQIPAGAVVSARLPQHITPEPPTGAPLSNSTPKALSTQASRQPDPNGHPASSSPSATSNTRLNDRESSGSSTSPGQQQQQQQQQQIQKVPSITSQLLSSTNQIGITSSGPIPAAYANAAIQAADEIPFSPSILKKSISYQMDNDNENGDDDGVSKSTSESQPSDSATGDAAHTLRMAHMALRRPSFVGPGHKHNPSIDTTANAEPPSLQATNPGAQAQQGRNDDSESAASSGSLGGGFMSRLKSMRVRRQKSTPATQPNPATMPTIQPPAGNAGFNSSQNGDSGMQGGSTSANGKVVINVPVSATKESSDANPTGQSQQQQPRQPTKDEFAEWAGPRYPTETERTLSLLQLPAIPWEQLYSPVICPRLPLPRNLVIQLCQEHFDASEPYSIYRNTIEAMAHPTHNDGSLSIFRVADDPLLSFELCMPSWLCDFLLFNHLPASYQEPAKLSFVLSPSPATTLAPFPNPNARLVANRMLRARKLAVYVVEKLGLPLLLQPPPNYINAVDSCVRAYSILMKRRKNKDEKQEQAPAQNTPSTGNVYIDLFVEAGETVDEAERVALDDLASWQSNRHRKASEDAAATDGQAASLVYIGKPELYLDLTCKEKRVAPGYTLATIKAHQWKSSNDIQVHYAWANFVRQRVVKAQSLNAQVQ
ncbi:hypothetical protein GGI12_002746 [Dipsacomyces acuminosporus]|nr:hypothetical protein GGI12_002746 [Dipsacomyces acuminosporus]